MNYVIFEVGNKEYKLRLNVRNIVALEKRLGCNPLTIFGEGDKMPTITEMVNILHCSLQQLNHGITLEDSYTIFENWIEEGHNALDFLTVIVDIYKVSGIISNKAAEEAAEKN